MSQFYSSTPWQTGWNAPGDVSGAYMPSGAHSAGWSTSWDEMMGDSARMVHKQDHSRTTTEAGSAGFSAGANPASNATGNTSSYDKPASAYYELLSGQSWDAVHTTQAPSKQAFATTNVTSTVAPQKSISKPVTTPSAPVWVEVTSAEGWTVPSAGIAGVTSPTTPTKTRTKSSENALTPLSSPQAHMGAYQPPSPNGPASNGKRHHDIEDELGHQDRYKTELCRSWHESGTCRYGSKCQFAHGSHELRPVMRHPKYKTEPCRSWVETRSCPYGRRCRFIHSEHASLNSASNASINFSSNGNMPSNASNGSAVGILGNNGNHHAHMQMHASQHAHHMSHLQHHATHHQSGAIHAHNNDHMTTTRHLSTSYLGSSPTSPAFPHERALSVDSHAAQMQAYHQHHIQQQQMNSRANNGAGNGVSVLPPNRARVAASEYMPIHSFHGHMAPSQAYPASQQAFVSQIGLSQGTNGASSAMYAINGSPPYQPNNFGLGVPLFSGSPPLSSVNSRETLAAARASNAPWLYDTFQDDGAEDDDDDYDHTLDSLPLTPLIEQLNLHAEPVSPTLSHNQNHAPVAPIAPPSAPGKDGKDAASASPSPTPSDASHEKTKKKKGNRLHIFRLSSK